MRSTVSPILTALVVAGCVGAPSALQSMVPVIDIPRVDHTQVFDGELTEYETSRHVLGSFRIGEHSLFHGEYPVDIGLAYDEHGLRWAVEISGLGPQPYNNKTHEFPFHLALYFADDSGTLNLPSDGLYIMTAEGRGWTLDDKYWNGEIWHEQRDMADHPAGKRISGGIRSEKLTIEGHVGDRSPLVEHDGFRPQAGEVFRMIVMFGAQMGDEGRAYGESLRHLNDSQLTYADLRGMGTYPHADSAWAIHDPTGWLRIRVPR